MASICGAKSAWSCEKQAEVYIRIVKRHKPDAINILVLQRATEFVRVFYEIGNHAYIAIPVLESESEPEGLLHQGCFPESSRWLYEQYLADESLYGKTITGRENES